MVAGPPTLTHCGLPVSTPTLELALGTRHFHCLLLVAPTWYMTYIALWYKMRKIYESSISFDWTQEVPKRTQAIWKVRINLLPIASWVPGLSVARKMYPLLHLYPVWVVSIFTLHAQCTMQQGLTFEEQKYHEMFNFENWFLCQFSSNTWFFLAGALSTPPKLENAKRNLQISI